MSDPGTIWIINLSEIPSTASKTLINKNRLMQAANTVSNVVTFKKLSPSPAPVLATVGVGCEKGRNSAFRVSLDIPREQKRESFMVRCM